MCLSNFWKLVALLALLLSYSEGRPLLVDSSVWYTNQTVLNRNYELGVVRMEFNETVYVNGWTFLCSSAGMSCPPLTCQACDWSGQQVTFEGGREVFAINFSFFQPSGCSDTSCCGPAQDGQPSAIINEWCDSPVPYESLKLNEKSR